MTGSITVLYVGTDENAAENAAVALEQEYSTLSVASVTRTDDAMELIESGEIECVVYEQSADSSADLDVLETVADTHLDLPTILVSDQYSEELARDAIEIGVTDVVPDVESISAVRLGNRIQQYVESHRTRESLEEREAHHRALRESASDVIVTIDEESIVTSVNEAAVDLFGYDREELLGNSLTMLMSDDLAEQHRQSIERYLRTGERRLDWDYLELPGRHKDGHVVPLGVSFGEFTYQGDRFFTGVLRDITERNELEDELRRERNLKDSIVETSPVGIAIFDSEGKFTFANRRAENLLGLQESTLQGYTYDDPEFDIVDPDGDPISDSDLPFRQVLETKEPVFNEEVGVTRPDGTMVWLSVNAAPLHERADDDHKVIVVFSDITEQVNLETERDRMLGRVSDAFYAVDDEFRFTFVNDRAEELLQRPEEELLGESIWELYPEATETDAWDSFHEALETQEPTSYNLYFDPLEFWVEANVYPSETGLSVYFRDVTERKEREEALRESRERLNRLIDAIDEYAIFMLDTDGHVISWNTGAEQIKGYTEAEIIGQHFSTFYPEEDVEDEVPEQFLQQAREEGVAQLEGWRVRKDGSKFWANVVLTALQDDEGELRGFAKVTRDMTERMEYEKELEERERRYRTLVENFPGGAVGLFDDDLYYTTVGGQLLDEVGVDPEDRIGKSILEFYSDDIAEELEPHFRAVFDGEKNTFEVEQHDRHLWAHTLPVRNGDGEIFAGMLVVQDVTEQKERERALERHRERLTALNEVSQRLADAETGRDIADVVVEAAADALDLPYSAIALYDETTGDLRSTSKTDALSELVGEGPVFDKRGVAWQVFVEQESTILSDAPEQVDLFDSESPVRSVIALPLGEYGVFACVSPDRDAFSETDVQLTSLLVANSISALDRADRERDLREQTEALAERTRELERISRVNDVIRGITQELIQMSSREDVVQAVCDRITAAESYRFAWIGSADTASPEIAPEAWAGGDGSYFDELSISTDVDPDDREPAASALATETVYIQNRLHSERPFESWRRTAMERGYQSCIAVPLAYEERTYGVLSLYADTTDVFNELEAAVLEELGETIGYALNALEQKEALVSDRSVELEFKLADLTGSSFEFVTETDCEFEFENVVRRTDGLFHLFFTIRGTPPDPILAFAEDSEEVTDATCVAESDSEQLFEWTLTESSFLSDLLGRGAVLRTLDVDPSGGRIVVRVSAGAEIRPFVELFESEYDDVALIARREVDEPFLTQREFDAEFRDVLTDRQEEVLRTAYTAGFFESPRKSSAKDIADILDVSQPTVSRHIRASERKLFSLYFE